MVPQEVAGVVMEGACGRLGLIFEVTKEWGRAQAVSLEIKGNWNATPQLSIREVGESVQMDGSL